MSYSTNELIEYLTGYWKKATGIQYGQQHEIMKCAAERLEELRGALQAARDAWQDQLDFDIRAACPSKPNGTADLDRMDEVMKPMIDDTRALIARLDAALTAGFHKETAAAQPLSSGKQT